MNKRVSFLPFGLLSLIAKHSSSFLQMAIPISLNKFCLDFNAKNSTINKIKAALLYSIICLTIWMAKKKALKINLLQQQKCFSTQDSLEIKKFSHLSWVKEMLPCFPTMANFVFRSSLRRRRNPKTRQNACIISSETGHP